MSIPNRLVIHVNSKSNHCHAATNSRKEGKRSAAASSQRNTCNDCEEKPQSAKDDCARVFVHLSSRVLEDFNSIEGDGVNARKLIHHEVNDENCEGLQTRRRQKSLKDFFRRWFTKSANKSKLKEMSYARSLQNDSLFGTSFVRKLLELVNFSLNIVRTTTKFRQAFESFFRFLMSYEIVG